MITQELALLRQIEKLVLENIKSTEGIEKLQAENKELNEKLNQFIGRRNQVKKMKQCLKFYSQFCDIGTTAENCLIELGLNDE